MKKKEVGEIHTLAGIRSPEDLKAFRKEELPSLCGEIRQTLVDTVTVTGGHLASNLGAVELTVAIHRVFSCPTDHVIFDVGHQSYVHKMLTGRLDRMKTLRTAGGLSGFPKRSESEYDAFGTGHSSTALSASLGFAEADKLQGKDAYTVCVVGDGAFTGGMVHEALNNLDSDLRLVVILNENEMSISKNIGRFAFGLAKLRNRRSYYKAKHATETVLTHIPLIGKPTANFLRRVKKRWKNTLYGSNYFEKMGLTYLGPVNGHDSVTLERVLTEAKRLQKSVLVHVKTEKGKGYAPAEEHPDLYHGVSPEGGKSSVADFSHVMGDTLCKMAKEDGKICAVTAAMGISTGLAKFAETYPDRYFDVGIAEAHALTFAAGLAADGLHPFTAIYSTFLQRGYDSILHDIALQNLPVTLLIDRAGLSEKDGATHHGIFDVSFLSGVPGMILYTPSCFASLRAVLPLCAKEDRLCAVRYPAGGENAEVSALFGNGPFTPVRLSEEGKTGYIVAHGRMLSEALRAQKTLTSEGADVGVLDLEQVLPTADVAKRVADLLPKETAFLVFAEEEIGAGGMGMMMEDALHRLRPELKFARVAVKDFAERREAGKNVRESAGVDATAVAEAVRSLFRGEPV